MKLFAWATANGLVYRTAWRMSRDGRLLCGRREGDLGSGGRRLIRRGAADALVTVSR
jgi:hypothetical protein